MKKVTSREFQHGFAKITGALKPGQSITITVHGKPIGHFTKQPTRAIKTPNFLEAMKEMDPKVGQSILEDFGHDALL